MSYSNLFANHPVPSGYGGEKTTSSIQDIESWLRGKDIKTTAKRIDFILNGVSIDKIGVTQISDVGEHHVNEASEANRCVDRVVTDFAELKVMLDEPKTLILEALEIIEGKTKHSGLFGFIAGFKQTKPSLIRGQVQEKLLEASNLYRQRVKYKLNPFIDGLAEATRVLEKIAVDLDNTINALNYLIDKTQDKSVQDFAYRRKEMFVKSLALMQMNLGQMNSMSEICEKNKLFVSELEMNVMPIIENILRTSLISGEDKMGDIAKALKGIL